MNRKVNYSLHNFRILTATAFYSGNYATTEILFIFKQHVARANRINVWLKQFTSKNNKDVSAGNLKECFKMSQKSISSTQEKDQSVSKSQKKDTNVFKKKIFSFKKLKNFKISFFTLILIQEIKSRHIPIQLNKSLTEHILQS